VGAGWPGPKAAEALRTNGFGGKVILIGDEADRPYDRPPLSKGYLLGSTEREKIYIHPAQWHLEHDIDLRLGTQVATPRPPVKNNAPPVQRQPPPSSRYASSSITPLCRKERSGPPDESVTSHRGQKRPAHANCVTASERGLPRSTGNSNAIMSGMQVERFLGTSDPRPQTLLARQKIFGAPSEKRNAGRAYRPPGASDCLISACCTEAPCGPS
jgi:hypothetical protein